MVASQQRQIDFPASAPVAYPLFYRTYSRLTDEGQRESWEQVCRRTVAGLKELGALTDDETALLTRMQRQVVALPSGRWLWVGGTDWSKKPENFSGSYNCTSTNVTDWRAFGLMMDLAMQGCGTGAVLEDRYISQLPVIRNRLNVVIDGEIGSARPEEKHDKTLVDSEDNRVLIVVGDSRQGWAESYQRLLELSADPSFDGPVVDVFVDLSSVRPSGARLRGFGGIANPVKLPGLYGRCAAILNKAIGRKLNAVECCLLIDEAASCVVAGSIRRSAGMRQFDSTDALAATAKDDLWQQGEDGQWRIDPERDVLRMANHTRVFHQKPSLEDCVDSVRKQFYSGEGAIQWAGEAKRRAGAEDRYGLNPCLVGSTQLLTPEGYKPIQDLVSDSVRIINKDGDVVKGKVWCSGEKETVILSLTNHHVIQCTPDHVFQLNDGSQSEAQNLKGKQLMPFLKRPDHDLYWVLLGFIQGDGCLSLVGKPSVPGVYLNVGRKDFEIATILDQLDIKYRWHGDRHVYISGLTEDLKDLLFDFQVLPQRNLPTTYPRWNRDKKAAFLSGLYAANGSVVSTGRFTLKSTSLALIEQVKQSLEDDFGIDCYYTTNKSKPVQFSNGVYQCKESYDLNIQSFKSRQAFFNAIGFTLSHKVDKAAYLLTEQSPAIRAVKPAGIEFVYDFNEPLTHWGVAEGFVTHNCGEIIGSNYHCNLAEVHLNQIDPHDYATQNDAFKAAALSVAVLLNHQFMEPRYQQSRLEDPIVGVSFTGLFDFFVNAFGVDWLHWWESGRPDAGRGRIFKEMEQDYLTRWRNIAHQAVWDYCDRHGLKRPNRCTTVQPAGSKSLLTGASPGWHPPKAQRFIRRVTFRKGDPVALACIDYGYTVVPSQSDKDDDGNLLNDPFDPRCTEWLVEIPVEVPWANLPGADAIHIERFSVAAQFDFYMQVQKHYTTHNCFARSTPFLTDKGVKTFEDFEVGETVTVLNSDGDWVPAEVVNTGETRPMLTITIQEGKTGKQKTITSTYCHRFPVRRISGGDSKVKIVKAEDLKIGHRLVLNAADLPDMDEDGIRHGIVFGDGSLYKNSKGEYHAAQLPLCGGKRHLQSYFTNFERTYERDDIDQTRIYGMPPEWKYLPSADCSQGYLAGFVAGLLATDGNISRSTISLSTGRQNVVDFLVSQCPRLGIKINGYKWFESSNYKEGGGAFKVRVSKSTFPENMILRPHHMEHYRAHESQPCQWRVIEIEEAPEQVGWCVMEPITNHFTLTDNILVMNTSATLEMREAEIEELAGLIHNAIENDEGYISAALLARFDDLQTFPRLPFEPIDKATYEELSAAVLERRATDDFHAALARYDAGELVEAGPAGCDSDKCMMPEKKR